MAEFVDLKKKVDKIFQENDLEGLPPVRVGFAIDVSGSTSSLYASGVMQETVNVIFPIAFRLDDNGEMDFAKFGSQFELLDPVTKDNHKGYLYNNHVNAENQGTAYEPIVSDYHSHYFGVNKAKELLGKVAGFFGKKSASVGRCLPAVVIVLTDGACTDNLATRAALKATDRSGSDQPIFFLWVGVGAQEDFVYLQSYRKEFKHCDHVYFSDLNVSADHIYQQLFTAKFVNWLKGFK